MMKRFKSILKVLFVFTTIIGLVGSYLLFGLHSGSSRPIQPAQNSHQQANTTEQLPINEEDLGQLDDSLDADEEPITERPNEGPPLQDDVNELESAEEEDKEPEIFHIYQ